MDRKIIFITGASGTIGQALARSFAGRPYRLRLLLRKAREASPALRGRADIETIPGDLLSPASYAGGLEGVHAVVHLAALVKSKDPASYFAVNASATKDLLKECRSNGVKRFIFISTCAISKEGGPYSRSKLLAEGYVREGGLDWVIIRFSDVYGTGMDRGIDFLFNKIRRAAFVPVIGDGSYPIAPLHIDDAVWAINAVIERPWISRKSYVVAGPEAFSCKSLVNKVKEIRKARAVNVHIPVFFLRVAIAIMELFSRNPRFVSDQIPRLLSEKSYDISEARADLEFRPAGIEDILRRNGQV